MGLWFAVPADGEIAAVFHTTNILVEYPSELMRREAYFGTRMWTIPAS
jgi:hypothetical protein